MSLNNREWAILFWLLVALVWAVLQPAFRSTLRGLGRSLQHPKLLVPLLAMIAYADVFVWLGWRLGVWNWSLIPETVIWFFGSALVLFFNLNKASEQEAFFRRVALRTIEVTVFIEFFMNVFVLALPAELVLQPMVLLLMLLSLVAGRQAEDRGVKRFVDALAAVMGLGLAAFSVVQLFRQWDQLDRGTHLLEFALPVWLTLALLPFVYILSLWVSYGVAFLRIRWTAKDARSRRRAKLALVTVLHGRTRDVRAFAGHWAQEAASAGSLKAARSVVRGFRGSRRRREAALKEEEERQRRYAGVTGTDSQGQQLDRREFEETTRALRWLATCQTGWYRRDGRYRDDMLDILNNDFAPYGLPSDHGITMRVAEDGQSWWAWRRTVTGWCFALGAAGPPPEQWEFDGQEPPGGVPQGGSAVERGAAFHTIESQLVTARLDGSRLVRPVAGLELLSSGRRPTLGPPCRLKFAHVSWLCGRSGTVSRSAYLNAREAWSASC